MKARHVLLMLASMWLLSGCAGILIAGAATTTANIAIDPREPKQILKDTETEFSITALNNKPPFRGEMRIVPSVYDGHALLLGQSTSSELLRDFSQRVKAMNDVISLKSQVEEKTPITLSTISQDTWITTKVKSAILADSELSLVKIKVITEDKSVYLLGYATVAQGDKAANIASHIKGVKRVVKNFQ